MKGKYIVAIAAAVAVISGVFGYYCWLQYSTTVILVRHAEKEDSSANTDLSDIGVARAETLEKALRDSGVSAIFTTDYCRTAQTAQPLAATLNLPLNVQSISGITDSLDDCDPEITVGRTTLDAQIASTQALIDHILTSHARKVILVVGHSNTVPDMVTHLGIPSLCPDYFPLVNGQCWIPSSQYDNLFVITKYRYLVNPRIIKARY